MGTNMNETKSEVLKVRITPTIRQACRNLRASGARQGGRGGHGSGSVHRGQPATTQLMGARLEGRGGYAGGTSGKDDDAGEEGLTIKAHCSSIDSASAPSTH